MQSIAADAAEQWFHDDGFVMAASELYMRVVTNRKAISKHRRRMKDKIPPTGRIILLTLTEKQWKSVEYLAGEPSYQELAVGSKSHVVL